MIKEIELSISPDFIQNYDFIKNQAAKKLHLNVNEINSVAILKRSILHAVFMNAKKDSLWVYPFISE